MDETFRKTWRKEIVSSAGFRVHLSGRNTLSYRDAHGDLRVATEAMAGSGITVAVFSESIPDGPERSRAQVMDNIARAFNSAGWVLVPS